MIKLISKIFMYLLAIGLGVVFALYLSASIGWTFVYVLVFAVIFSFLVTLFLSKGERITLSADVNRTMLYKGETAVLRITVKNRSVFPVPAVKINLTLPKGLEPDDSETHTSYETYTSYVTSVPPRSESVVEIKYKAKVWGVCNIGAECAFLHDFMDFFRFRLSCINALCQIKVFPDIPEIQGDSPLLRSAAEIARFADDSEETRESDSVTKFSGLPGYTHREYVEGDPVRRINWKLSSKRDKYMVRLDDEIESVQQNVVLDCCGGNSVLENERAVEGMLGVALGMLKCGFESTVYCRFGNSYEAFEITEPADVSALQTRLADFTFAGVLAGKKIKERIPVSMLGSAGGSRSIMLFTPLFDSSLAAEISSAEEQGITTAVVSSDSASTAGAPQVWRLNADYSAELIT